MTGNGKQEQTEPAPAPPQQTITIDEINGRLTELQELNQIFMARCAQYRGQLAFKDAQIVNLLRELNELKASQTKLEGDKK